MTTRELAARFLPPTTARYTRLPWLVITRTLDLVVTGFTAIFQIVMILTQSLQPGYNPLRDTISSMVWGPFGWLQTVNFYLCGFLLIILVRRLRVCMTHDIVAKAASMLLLLIGVGFIILAICPTQSPGNAKTIQAIIHGISVYFITFSFPASCFLVASSLHKNHRNILIYFYTIVTGCIGVVLIAVGVYLNIAGAHWFGMLERVLLLNGFTWLVIMYVLRGVYILKS
jgi:hypothetical protein